MTSTTTSRTYALSLLLLGLALGLLVGMFVGGAATPSSLGDVGDSVRWLTPSFRSLSHLAEAVTIGSLVFAAFTLEAKSKAFTKTVSLTASASAVWALSGTAYLISTYLAITGLQFSLDKPFADQFYIFITDIQLGQMLVLNVLAAFAISMFALLVRNLLVLQFLPPWG